MSRKEELLLAVFSGILLAFGIHEDGRERTCKGDPRVELCQDSERIGEYWNRVGGYMRKAQEREQSSQANA